MYKGKSYIIILKGFHHLFQLTHRANHSCQSALTKMVESWLSVIDEGEIVACAKLDFKKAFDTVNHNKVIEKLAIYQLDKSCLQWMKSYLFNRQQSVKIDNVLSDPLPIQAEVPQGSILGPLIFIIYVNDLLLCSTTSTMDLYADDTTISRHGNDVTGLENTINKDLQIIER